MEQTPFYAPGAGSPSFIEDDMFTAIVPLTPVPEKIIPPGGAPVGAPVEAPVRRLLDLLSAQGEMSNAEILKAFALKSRRRMRETYIAPALRDFFIERTIPGKPNSRLQKYRLTAAGKRLAEELK